jgi:hypothetical protein
MGRGGRGYPAGLYLACWIFLCLTKATIGSLVEPLRSRKMSPLQVMVCYINSPAVVLSIFITARVGLTNLLNQYGKASPIFSSNLTDNVVPFRKRNSNLAA